MTAANTAANAAVLRDWLRRHRGIDLADYAALHRWSVHDVAGFWRTMWDYFDLQSTTPPGVVLSGSTMPDVHWFAGTQLNYVSQIARHAAVLDVAGQPAVVFRNERLQHEGRSVEIAWHTLLDDVARLAASLQQAGVEHGDRVAAYLPNIPQALIAFLACASLGAVWSMTAPDMGVGTVRDRFVQIAPKVLIACDGTVYGGKTIDRRATVAALLEALPSVTTLVLVPYLEDAGAPNGPFTFDAPVSWPGVVRTWHHMLDGSARVAPQAVPFEHPLWIVYSSGTTGMPKPIVHGHGGIVITMLKDSRFHLDLHPSNVNAERLFWYSSTGWMMWNIAIGSLLGGTTTCLYDGHANHPNAETLWRFVDDVGATFFGAGAAYYTGCMKAGLSPKSFMTKLGTLRSLGSTGSPLAPEAFRWGQAQVRDDIWWAVISGGTDIAGSFLAGTPELPTVPGEMQARALGADVQAWDEHGRPLIDEVGELVCTQPLPAMPVCFWNDHDGARYRDSYFDVYPGVWRHGDWLKITSRGSTIVYGRSDATLNRHGHRMGTSELYRVVEALPEVLDSLVVDIEVLGRPSFMPLFVVLRPGLVLDSAMTQRIRHAIRDGVSPRFVPDEIAQVTEVPRTLTGKKQELPVKKLMLGRAVAEVVNKGACANPDAFDWFVNYARQRAAQEQNR